MDDITRASSSCHLLDRCIDDAYLSEWTDLISRSKEEAVNSLCHSVLVFRLQAEWLALSTLLFSDIDTMRVIRKIPHYSNGMLKGLVNLRGRLHICIDLAKLLEIDPAEEAKKKMSRIAAITKDQQKWVFVADEILGIFSYCESDLKNVPVTIAKSSVNYLKGTCIIENLAVSILDEELLFYRLEKRML